MSTHLEDPRAQDGQPEVAPLAPVTDSPVDWEALIANPFDIGLFQRITKSGDWTIINGMHVQIEEELARLPADAKKVLVLAETLGAGKPTAQRLDISRFKELVVFGNTLNLNNSFKFQVDVPCDLKLWIHVLHINHFNPRDSRLGVVVLHGDKAEEVQEDILYMYPPGCELRFFVNHGTINSWSARAGSLAINYLEPLPACTPFLERLLLAALAAAANGRRDLALDLVLRLQELLQLVPDRPFWRHIGNDVPLLREALQPFAPEPTHVPYLSPSVYAGVATAYGPALKAYGDSLQQVLNRTSDLAQRKRAAQLILDEKGDAGNFQELVGTQVAENLKLATDNTKKAQASIDSQQKRVTRAEATFKAGLDAWREQQKREAALAIVGGVFSFVASVGSIFAGNPAGAAGAAQAAAAVATTAAKLADLMKKLAKLAQVVAKLVEMCQKIVAAAAQIANAQEFADRLANARHEAESGGIQDAPSAGAYWDQLWVEVETMLNPAVGASVGGAAEYLKELKVLVIYGRALTAAQAALPPLLQEMARASLQADIATRQRQAMTQEVANLAAGQLASTGLAIDLWRRYYAVQRAIVTALQSFDAAHRYWALTDERPEREAGRALSDLAGDLLQIADIKDRQRRALESFVPPPQDFTRELYTVPPSALEELLRDGSFTVPFLPGTGPLQDRGRVGRVRVREIWAWVEWQAGKRPATGAVELTVRTNGSYDDRLVTKAGEKRFHFTGTPVNLTFRYDLTNYSDANRHAAVTTAAHIADEFRTAYLEPTLFTEWRFSLPTGSGIVDREALRAAMSGITLEFSGTFIKDPDRFHLAQ